MPDAPRSLFDTLTEIHRRPEPFAVYTARELWDDEHVSSQMLAFHLDAAAEPASRPKDFLDRSAAWIADRFALQAGRRVADFGCGPGLYSARFATTGAEVTGIDFSRRSIAHAEQVARERGLDITYVLADYLEYRADRTFDLITLIYCDLCPLSPAQRHRLLTSFRDQLAGGGSVLLDVSSHEAFAARQEAASHGYCLMDGFWAEAPYWGFLDTFKYDEARIALDKYTIVEPERTRTIYNWMQHFSVEQLTAELAQCGLRIVERYGDVAGTAFGEGDGKVMAVVAQRA